MTDNLFHILSTFQKMT